MSDIEKIKLSTAATWVLQTKNTLNGLRREGLELGVLYNSVSARCLSVPEIRGIGGVATTAPEECVDLATAMQDLRAAAAEVYDHIRPGGPGNADVEIDGDGVATVSSAAIGKVLGNDWGPDVDDLSPSERKRYRHLVDQGVGPWQAAILADESDPDAAMLELLDLMADGEAPPDDLTDYERRMLVPDGWEEGKEWHRGEAAIAMAEHGSLAQDVEVGVHVALYERHRANWRDSDWPDYSDVVASRLAGNAEAATLFYRSIDALAVQDLGDEDPLVAALFGDALALASHAGLPYTGSDVMTAGHNASTSDAAALFLGTEAFESQFLFSAAGVGGSNRNGPLTKVVQQELSAEFVSQLSDSELAFLLNSRTRGHFFNEKYGHDDLALLPEPPMTLLLAQASLDPQAADRIIGTVEQMQVSAAGNDDELQLFPDVAVGVGRTLINSMDRRSHENANGLLSTSATGGRPDQFFVVSEVVFKSGAGAELLLGSQGFLAQAQLLDIESGEYSGRDSAEAAAFAGQLEALYHQVQLEGATELDERYSLQSTIAAWTGVGAGAGGLAVAALGSNPAGWAVAGVGLTFIGIGASVYTILYPDENHRAQVLEEQLDDALSRSDRLRGAILSAAIQSGEVEFREPGQAPGEGTVVELDPTGTAVVIDGEIVQLADSEIGENLYFADSDQHLEGDLSDMMINVDQAYGDPFQEGYEAPVREDPTSPPVPGDDDFVGPLVPEPTFPQLIPDLLNPDDTPDSRPDSPVFLDYEPSQSDQHYDPNRESQFGQTG